MKRDAFLNSSADELVRRLTVDEKIALLSAPNWWNTTRMSGVDPLVSHAADMKQQFLGLAYRPCA
jgi:hypothetical protein